MSLKRLLTERVSIRVSVRLTQYRPCLMRLPTDPVSVRLATDPVSVRLATDPVSVRLPTDGRLLEAAY